MLLFERSIYLYHLKSGTIRRIQVVKSQKSSDGIQHCERSQAFRLSYSFHELTLASRLPMREKHVW
jgi:hypothetical protein